MGLHRWRRAALLLAALGPAACQQPGTGDQGETGQTPVSPMLYEIAAADGTAEGWLIGTIHALPEPVDWRTPAVEQVMETADLLIVEVAGLDDARALPRIFAELGTAPGLPPLAQRVAPADRPLLAQALVKARLEPADLARHETWSAALLLAQATSQGDPAHGMDRGLIAAFRPRPVRELEGARGQLAIFDGLPEREQRDLLKQVVLSATDNASLDRSARLRAAWIAGDAAAMAAATTTGLMADPELRSALLIRRNERWLRAIAPLLATSERPLIAVGAAHLFGGQGLIAGLEARGYSIRRIASPAPKPR